MTPKVKKTSVMASVIAVIHSLCFLCAMNASVASETDFLDGVGDLRLGATFRDIKALGIRPLPQDNGVVEDDLPTVECANTFFMRTSSAMGALFSRGAVKRIDILGTGTSTNAGVHVGSNLGEVRKAYGSDLKIFKRAEDQPFDVNGPIGGPVGDTFLFKKSGDGARLLLIELANNVVQAIHVGFTPYFTSSVSMPVFIADCTTIREFGGWQNNPHP